MLICATCPIGSADLVFLHLYIYVEQSDTYRGIIEGGIKNTCTSSINEFRIYLEKLENTRVETYSKKDILDQNHERNTFYSKFESSTDPVTGTGKVTIDRYPAMMVKDFTAGQEVAGANQQFFKISVTVPEGISSNEILFFRINCSSNLPLKEKDYVLVAKKILDLRIYPNAYPELPTFDDLGIEAMDKLIGVQEFHAWISLPKGYVFIDPPELPYKYKYDNQEFESIMIREKNIHDGRLFKRIQYAGRKTRFILNNLSIILAIIALILSAIGIGLFFIRK